MRIPFGLLRAAAVSSLALVCVACSAPANMDGTSGDAADIVGGDTSHDARGDVTSTACATDLDCDDTVFCNGAERCMPGAVGADGRGCVAANPSNACLSGQTCDESMRRCITTCSHASDADGDGHRATDCGGDDCDDSDANRFPGNPEVCDSAGHDEDCEATTFGLRDSDGDLYVDANCCNMDSSGTRHCGDDCNDTRPNVHPALAESCDGLDNDCNGSIDEGVMRTFYPDTDGDGYGNGMAPSTMTRTGCIPPTGYAEMGTDCNDGDSAIHPGALEQCDAAMADENCDGSANPTSLCACNGDVTRPCATLTGACAAGTERCVNGSWGLCSIAPTPELCNGVDDNCDGRTDEGLAVTCYPDGDNDGYAASGAVAAQVCPVPGRDAFAGCPPNQTNRAPIGATAADCNDANSTVNPGASELCDIARVDEDCDGAANPMTLCSCTDGQTRPCTAPGSCGAGNQVCSGGHFSVCSVNPVPESCNGVDDNCNGTVDEGLTITCYADQDNDGYAAAGATAIQSCPVMGRDFVGGCPTNQTNRAPAMNNVDCADTIAAINPAAVELCDAAHVDEDCDGAANPTSLCACSGTSMRMCSLSGACAAGTQTCSGGNWGNCSISPVAESCNGIDDNCNGTVDEGVTVTCYPDADNDGYATMGAASVPSCPIAGREAAGGCPTGRTNRAPASASTSDCNDSASTVNPAAPEQCDAAMVDENCDGSANPSTLCACSGTATRMCTLPGACAASTQTCSMGAWGACSILPTTETCNGVDDNCNGMTDEGVTITCYADADNDGYAATGATSMQSCSVPGRASVGGCPTNQTNRAPTTGNVDCNDGNASVNPGAIEQCDAAMVDENCDGSANPMSLCACSGSATRSCPLPGPCASGTQTCTSGAWGTCSVQPVAEVCNGTDDNCNGSTDEGLTVTCYVDADNDGFAASTATSSQRCPITGREAVGGCPTGFTNRMPAAGTTDCNDTQASINPAATELCDAAMVDENCDGMANPSSTCQCSGSATRACMASGACASGTQTCTGGVWGACSIRPAAEVCNGIDDDCDGTVDNGVLVTFYRDTDADGFGVAGMTTTACTAPTGYASRSGDCNDSDRNVNPAATERCDGVDNNCDGMTDPGCACTDGTTRPCGTSSTGVCRMGLQQCVGGTWSTCSGNVNPGTETCNGLDDDCDGVVDNGVTVSGCYADFDADTYGVGGPSTQCRDASRAAVGFCPIGYTNRASPADCNDAAAAINPAAAETCNGVDDNCNGQRDETFPCVQNTTGIGCATGCGTAGTRACTATCTLGACAAATETCNGCDDNGNGTSDEGFSCRQGSTQSCTTSCGTPGTATCAADCSGYAFCRATEQCNGCDDDLNGVADDPYTCAAGQVYPCTTACGVATTRVCNSSCGFGTCLTTAEVCNYCDDNGNGSTDDEAPIASQAQQFDMAQACNRFLPIQIESGCTASGWELTSTTNDVGALWWGKGLIDGTNRTPVRLGYGPLTITVRVYAASVTATPADGWAITLTPVSPTTSSIGSGATNYGVVNQTYPNHQLTAAWRFWSTNYAISADPDMVEGIAYAAGSTPGDPIGNPVLWSSVTGTPAGGHLSGPAGTSAIQEMTLQYTPPVNGGAPAYAVWAGARGIGTAGTPQIARSGTNSGVPYWRPGTDLYVQLSGGTGAAAARVAVNYAWMTPSGHCIADGTARIVPTSPSAPNIGRIEVFRAGRWGTVCDDGPGGAGAPSAGIARVVCRQLGYSAGTVVDSPSTPDGSGPIWFDNMDCTGFESTLAGCGGSSLTYGDHDCSHSEDLGVNCN